MDLKRCVFLTIRAAVLALLLSSAAAQSQSARSQQTGASGSGNSYPTKPVRVIVGLAPGGGADMVARTVAQKLSQSLGQSFVVENRSGAAGTIAIAYVANLPADGYTLLSVASEFSAYPALYLNVPYDPIKNFAPVSLISYAPFMLVVHPSVPAKTVKDVIGLAKKRPRALDVASAGIGSSGHLAGELFQSMAGIKLTHIPYKGSGLALADLMAGNVHLLFSSIISSMNQVKSGRLRALGVTSAKRSAAMPDIPTISESGVAGYEATNWYGWLAPAGTPAAVISKLNAEIVSMLKLPDVTSRLAAEGGEAIGSTPEQFTNHLTAEIARKRRLINDAGVRIE
jgi:tripartite-type tricarboxylate transporter receptor subunit TctC